MLKLIHYGSNLNLFIPTPEDVGAYYMCNRDVGKRYFFMQFTIPNPFKDLFLREKPENGYRIFVLGGSTAAGFPYANNLTFSHILCHLLQDAYPEKQIEVVNLGMAAICSYTLHDFMDEVLNQNPDAILIYAGHNEFYGALGVASIEFLGQNPRVVRTYLKLTQFRTFLFIRNIIGQIKKRFNKIKYNRDEVEPTATLMERIVSEQTIPLGSPLYQKGMNQFQQNLDAILKKT